MEERPVGAQTACGLEANLLQGQGTGECKLIAYISRLLTSTETLRRYSQIEREGPGCVLAIEHLHDYLFGLEFTLIIDNKLLPYHRVFSAQLGDCTSILFVFSISQVTLTQQIHYHVCRPSKMIFPILVWFVKTT